MSLARMAMFGCSRAWKRWPFSIAQPGKVALLKTMLQNFSGVLVSDFYAPYDAIECPQQKCLIYLIRDLNDELLRHHLMTGSSGSLRILQAWSGR